MWLSIEFDTYDSCLYYPPDKLCFRCLFFNVGDPEVGKTSIFLRYTKNQFDYSYQPSVSVSIGNVVKHVNIPYETIVSLALWDLPGREEMDLRRSYYKDVDAAIGKCL